MTTSHQELWVEENQSGSHPVAVRNGPTPIRSGTPVDLLLVHGDLGGQSELSASLSAGGHAVSTAFSLDGAIRLLGDDAFEVVVLSLGAAGAGSADAVGLLRAVSDVPLIVLGEDATSGVRDAVFNSGADDYLLEPVDPAELDRLVRARARRAETRRRGDELKGPANLIMQVRAHEVLVGSERLSLTPKEFSILRLFLEHRGEVVETDQISLNVWGHETYGSRNFVEAHISRLRQKLSRVDAGSVISTVRGIGYVVR